jgi:hypothetical protein
MSDHSGGIVSATAAALTIAAVEAGMPLAVGFLFAGLFGALVGHVRWVVDRERRDPTLGELPMRQQMCMVARAAIMGEFVCLVLLLVWLETGWPWTWGLIAGAISAVFGSDAIELMWTTVKARAGAYQSNTKVGGGP